MISEHSGPGCASLHARLHQPCPVVCSVTVDVLASDLVWRGSEMGRPQEIKVVTYLQCR